MNIPVFLYTKYSVTTNFLFEIGNKNTLNTINSYEGFFKLPSHFDHNVNLSENLINIIKQKELLPCIILSRKDLLTYYGEENYNKVYYNNTDKPLVEIQNSLLFINKKDFNDLESFADNIIRCIIEKGKIITAGKNEEFYLKNLEKSYFGASLSFELENYKSCCGMYLATNFYYEHYNYRSFLQNFANEMIELTYYNMYISNILGEHIYHKIDENNQNNKYAIAGYFNLLDYRKSISGIISNSQKYFEFLNNYIDKKNGVQNLLTSNYLYPIVVPATKFYGSFPKLDLQFTDYINSFKYE